MTKISVLMPVYKTNEQYLREAIESILNQTFTDFEFLILDDCPNDTRERIVKSYKDKRIKYAINEKNLGISASRNKLIEMAKGEYLATFDHDDISYPERFEKEVKYLDEHKDVGVVSSWFRNLPSYKISKFPANNYDIKVCLTDGCYVPHSASMIRKSVLIDNNIRYEEEFSPAEDWALWCRLIDVTNFHNIQDVLLDYRWHETNTSKTQNDKMDKASLMVESLVKTKYPHLNMAYNLGSTWVYKIALFNKFTLIKIKQSRHLKKFYLLGCLLFSIKETPHIDFFHKKQSRIDCILKECQDFADKTVKENKCSFDFRKYLVRELFKKHKKTNIFQYWLYRLTKKI